MSGGFGTSSEVGSVSNQLHPRSRMLTDSRTTRLEYLYRPLRECASEQGGIIGRAQRVAHAIEPSREISSAELGGGQKRCSLGMGKINFVLQLSVPLKHGFVWFTPGRRGTKNEILSKQS